MGRVSPASNRTIQFGVFEVDFRAGELRRRRGKVKLQEQPLQILQILLESPGEVVTKEELRQRIWPSDTFVDFDHGLHSAITRLREALGDSAESPSFIETLPRRGYRFIAQVKELGEDPQSASLSPEGLQKSSALVVAGLLVGAALLAIVLGFDVGGARQWLRRQSNPSIHSLAVLPLENLSGDPAQDYFA